ncbi:MAG: glycosyltransferase family 2 protein [Spirochaetaceae bacterium]|nr:glycosyltransferase family 2 protein [Spirochaetaceae bacterium]
MDVSIIIVSYNTRSLLKNCLFSIYKETKDIEFEVIVCDNASGDGSLEMIKTEFPQVVLIESKENAGFGAANNKAAEKAKGKYLFLLNSDALLRNNAPLIFYDYAQKNGKKVLGCFLRDENGNITHSFDDSKSVFVSFARIAYNSFPFLLKLKKKIIKKNYIHKEVSCKETFYITGAALFMEKKLFDAIGGFDEAFFMYFEDADLCRRAAAAGAPSFVISGPKIAHLEGKSSKNGVLKLMFIERGFLIYNKKYFSRVSFFVFKILYIIYGLLRFASPVYSFSEKKKLFLNIWV